MQFSYNTLHGTINYTKHINAFFSGIPKLYHQILLKNLRMGPQWTEKSLGLGAWTPNRIHVEGHQLMRRSIS